MLWKIYVLIFFVKDTDKKEIGMNMGVGHDVTWFLT